MVADRRVYFLGPSPLRDPCVLDWTRLLLPTPRERDVLTLLLLAEGFPDIEIYRAQLDSAVQWPRQSSRPVATVNRLTFYNLETSPPAVDRALARRESRTALAWIL